MQQYLDLLQDILDNGVTLFEHAGVQPRPNTPKPARELWSYLWGILPATALFSSIGLAIFLWRREV